MHPAISIFLVFVGCCCNVVFLELLVTEHQGSGNFIMFSQFLFITLEGFIFTMKFGRRKPVIPMLCYVKMATMYAINVFFQTVLLHYQVGIPLQQLLRSGTLIANLILGLVMLKKSYKPTKYLSIAMITIGIAMATLASANSRSTKENLIEIEKSSSQWLSNWFVGFLLFTFALYISGLMGIYQEIVFSKYGKHPIEALYYNHLLPLPVFLFFVRDIQHHAQLFTHSDSLPIPFVALWIPKMWAYLLGNVLSQYVCISRVFILTSECTSLTVTLVVTLRKFVSLIFSIIYFQNSFTVIHWIGTILVFGGTLLFADIFAISWSNLRKSPIKTE